jgi:hypothetical protein
MPQIFVSHSQRDTDIRAYFDTVFARTGVISKCMEFELIYPPAWEEIKNQITASEAVFLLLSQNVRSSIHTQNWVAFEVGLACAIGREVWVFEQLNSSIEFPIPYLTDYMIYDPQRPEDFNYIRSIVEGYGKPLSLLPLFVDNRTKRNIPKGFGLRCGNCNSGYSVHPEENGSLNCPSCRQPLYPVIT